MYDCISASEIYSASYSSSEGVCNVGVFGVVPNRTEPDQISFINSWICLAFSMVREAIILWGKSYSLFSMWDYRAKIGMGRGRWWPKVDVHCPLSKPPHLPLPIFCPTFYPFGMSIRIQGRIIDFPQIVNVHLRGVTIRRIGLKSRVPSPRRHRPSDQRISRVRASFSFPFAIWRLKGFSWATEINEEKPGTESDGWDDSDILHK